MVLKLSHIGEALISAILSSLAEQGKLGRVRCAYSDAKLIDDLQTAEPTFLADEALIRLQAPEQTFSGDGAQTIDILCIGPHRAVAMEAKLGETGMSIAAFRKRFCGQVEFSTHRDPRLTGSMVSVLETLLPIAGPYVFAFAGEVQWILHKYWWLVIRERIWRMWKRTLPVRYARVLVFDELARLYGNQAEFDELVERVVGTDFAVRWRLDWPAKRGPSR